MKDIIIGVYAFNLTFTRKLAADVPDVRLAEQPVAGRVMNHGAFLLGHLAWAGDNATRFLGREPALDEAHRTLFQTGAVPQADRSAYPSKDELLGRLDGAHQRLSDAYANATAEMLAAPAPERMRSRFPTVGVLIAALMTAHEANHNGQFSAWRRAAGFPPAV